MTLKFALVALCVALSCAGVVEFKYTVKVEWDIQGDSIAFKYYIPTEKIESGEWGWAGVGIKPIQLGHGMAHGDFVLVTFKADGMEDRFGVEKNANPPIDTTKGGTYDLNRCETTKTDTHTVYSWSRLLNTGDDKDTVLVEGGEYYLQWAWGIVNGVFVVHHFESYYQQITLTNDFEIAPAFISLV